MASHRSNVCSMTSTYRNNESVTNVID